MRTRWGSVLAALSLVIVWPATGSCQGLSGWLMAAGVPAAGGIRVAELARRYGPCVGMVTVNGQSHGTGFICGPRLVATAFHVVVDPGNVIAVVFPDHEPVSARMLRGDPGVDLCLLEVDSDPGSVGRPVPVPDQAALSPGEPVCIFGMDRWRVPLVTPGVVAGQPRCIFDSGGNEIHDISYFSIVGHTNPGNSGGPVFDERGKLVGVLKGGFEGANVSNVLPVSYLRKLLDSRADGPVVFGKATLDMEVGELVDESPAFLRRFTPALHHGLVVGRVVTGGPSWGIVSKGEVITRLNGRDIGSVCDYTESLGALPVGGSVTLTVRRPDPADGLEHDVRLTLGDVATEFLRTAVDGVVEVFSPVEEAWRTVAPAGAGCRYRVRARLDNLTSTTISSATVDPNTCECLTVVPGSVARVEPDGTRLNLPWDPADVRGVAVGPIEPGRDAAKPGDRTERPCVEFEVLVRGAGPEEGAGTHRVDVTIRFCGVAHHLRPAFLLTNWR